MGGGGWEDEVYVEGGGKGEGGTGRKQTGVNGRDERIWRIKGFLLMLKIIIIQGGILISLYGAHPISPVICPEHSIGGLTRLAKRSITKMFKIRGNTYM